MNKELAKTKNKPIDRDEEIRRLAEIIDERDNFIKNLMEEKEQLKKYASESNDYTRKLETAVEGLEKQLDSVVIRSEKAVGQLSDVLQKVQNDNKILNAEVNRLQQDVAEKNFGSTKTETKIIDAHLDSYTNDKAVVQKLSKMEQTLMEKLVDMDIDYKWYLKNINLHTDSTSVDGKQIQLLSVLDDLKFSLSKLRNYDDSRCLEKLEKINARLEKIEIIIFFVVICIVCIVLGMALTKVFF